MDDDAAQTSARDPHLDEDERTYLLKRAQMHEQLADTVAEATSRAVHRRLQQLYEEGAGRTQLVDPDQS